MGVLGAYPMLRARSNSCLWMPPRVARMARSYLRILWEGAMPPTVARMARFHHHNTAALAYR